MEKTVLVFALFGWLLLSACDSSSSTQQQQPSLKMNAQAVAGNTDTTLVTQGDTVTFTGAELTRHPDSIETRVKTRSGQIQVHNGFFLLANPNHSPVGEIDQQGNTIRVSIQAERKNPNPGAVPSIAVPVLYSAYVSDLEAGTYQFVLRHKGDTFRANDRDNYGEWMNVLDKQVEVK